MNLGHIGIGLIWMLLSALWFLLASQWASMGKARTALFVRCGGVIVALFGIGLIMWGILG